MDQWSAVHRNSSSSSDPRATSMSSGAMVSTSTSSLLAICVMSCISWRRSPAAARWRRCATAEACNARTAFLSSAAGGTMSPLCSSKPWARSAARMSRRSRLTTAADGVGCVSSGGGVLMAAAHSSSCDADPIEDRASLWIGPSAGSKLGILGRPSAIVGASQVLKEPECLAHADLSDLAEYQPDLLLRGRIGAYCYHVSQGGGVHGGGDVGRQADWRPAP